MLYILAKVFSHCLITKTWQFFYPEDNDTITPPVIGIYTSLCCSHSVVHISSGVKYRSFILEWLPHLCNDKRTWLHTFAVILNYEYLEAGYYAFLYYRVR